MYYVQLLKKRELFIPRPPPAGGGSYYPPVYEQLLLNCSMYDTGYFIKKGVYNVNQKDAIFLFFLLTGIAI